MKNFTSKVSLTNVSVAEKVGASTVLLRAFEAKMQFVSMTIAAFIFLLAGDIAKAQSVTYNTPGTFSTYTVPAGVTTLSFDVAGSRGGIGSGGGNGGNGGRVQGTLSVTPGQVLYIYVGGPGQDYAVGGAGGVSVGGEGGGVGGTGAGGGGGGAACDIRTDITGGATSATSLNSRIVVGGGGGGGNWDCTLRWPGGNGGYPTGGNGSGDCVGFTLAQGGTQTAGGTAGSGGGSPGGFGPGGASTHYSGGGGGGWYGGGGAYDGSGAGGSSTYGAGTSGVTTSTYTTAAQGYVTLCAYAPVGTVSVSPSNTICLGSSATVSTTGSGGTWSSASPSVATITGTTINSVGTGTSVISYTASNACGTIAATTIVTVVGVPAALSGASTVCGGTTITLSSATAGGAWSSSNTAVATVASATTTTGVVTGISGGTAIISYGGACPTTKLITVTGPTAILGSNFASVGGTSALSDATGSGTWSSSNPAIGSISTSGVVTGLSAGIITISYTVAGCAATMTFYVGILAPASCITTPASWTNSAITVNFNYTGSVQTWTVPSGVSTISTDLRGAAGGHDFGPTYGNSDGGKGGRLVANLPVTAGTTLNIYVGGVGVLGTGGAGAAGGYNGGGSGASQGTYGGGGGGGATDIRVGGTALANRVLVAGGGGGAGTDYAAIDADRGGHGGGTTGENGYDNSGNTAGRGGFGGGPTCCAANGAGTGGPGALGLGGNATAGSTAAGGGGGGYYGGGSGGSTYWSGAGGGSSYTDPSVTVFTHTQGYNTGNGFATISYTPTSLATNYGVDAFFVTAAIGSNLSDAGIAAAASPTTGYLDRTGLTPITLYTGSTFASSITWGTVSSYQEAQVWIDFNNDGIFQITEEVTGVLGYSTTGTTSPLSFNITIPAGAATGNHRMRVRGIREKAGTYALSTHLDPCLVQYLATNPLYNEGDAIDYNVNIQNPPACSGAPTAGTAVVTPGFGGASTVFTLSLTGATIAAGLSYQWQSSPDGVSGWTNISAGTTAPYTFTGITANTYYRCIVTCTVSGLSATSATTLATLISCTSTAASWVSSPVSLTFNYTGGLQTWTVPTGVSNVTVDMQGARGGGVNGYSTWQSNGGGGGRVQITGTGISVTAGHVLNILVGGIGNNTSGGGGYGGGGSDLVFSGAWPGAGGGGYSSITDNTTSAILVVAGGGGGGGGYGTGADVGGGGGGTTGANGVSGACGTGGRGGTPSAGGLGEVCTYVGGNGGFLTGGNATSGYGSGGGGGGYYGGGSGAYGGGGGGGSSYTNPTYVTGPVAHSQGYNGTGSGIVSINYTPTGIATTYGVDAFFVTAAVGSNLSDAGIAAAASSTTGYLDRTTLAPITLITGASYPSSITWGTATSYQEAQVWIDFNNDGIFQITEEVTGVLGYSTTSTTNPTTFNITIPAGAATGNHLMRVRGILELAGTYALSSHLDPCLVQYLATNPQYTQGDVVDYTVFIQNPGCTGMPTAGTAATSIAVACNTVTPTLTLTGATSGGGITYQWKSSSAIGGPYTAIGGATSTTYAPTVSSTTYYLATVTCTNSGLSANSTIALVSINPTPSISSASNNGPICGGATLTLTANSPANVTSYLWTGPVGITSSTASVATVPSATITATGIYTVTLTNGVGTGCTTTYTTAATVNPTPVMSGLSSAQTCYNATTSQNMSFSYGGVTGSPNQYTLTGWTPAGPLNVASFTTFTPPSAIFVAAGVPSLTAVGTYSATLTIRNSTTGCTSPYPATLVVNPLAVAVFTVSPGATTCAGTTVTYGVQSDYLLYNWTIPGTAGIDYILVSGGTGLSNTATITWITTGSKTVFVNCAAPPIGLCSSTVSNTTTVVASPTATVSSTGSPLCGSGTVTLNATPSGGVTGYSWTGPNLSSSTDQNPTATPTATATYSLTVSNAACSPTTVYTTTVTVNNPTAAPINNGPICSVGTVTLTANAAGGVTDYSWTGPNLSSATVANPTATPTATATYSLSVSMPGCSPVTVYTTTVTVNPAPTAAPSNNSPICNGGTVNLTANPIGGVTVYAWSGPNLSSATVANPTATPTATATYSLTVSSAGCLPSAVFTTVVTVNPTPAATPANSGPLCGTGTVTLTATPSGGATAFSWTGPGGFVSLLENPTATPTVTTTYSLTVSSGAASGCSPLTVYTTTVAVNNPIAAPTNNGPICSVGTVTLTANPAGGASEYSWTGPNLSSATAQNPTATPTATATYSLTVGAPGCSAVTVYTTTVTVNPAPTAAPSNNSPICNGGTVNLTANPIGGATGYAWSGPNLSSATAQNPTATPTTTATYSLTVSSAGCFPATVFTTIVTVNPTPSAAPTNSGPLCGSGTVTLTATPSVGATSFSWSGPGGFVSLLENPTATPTVTTTYSLTVSSGAASGCSPLTVYTTTVAVNNPTAAPTNNGPVCSAGTVTLTANPAGGTSLYSWTGPNLSSATAQNPTATPTATATYSLTVGAPGCSPTTVYTTVVSVTPAPTAAPSNNSPICNGGTVNLTANPIGGATGYAWSGPNLSSATAQNPTATPTTTATYSLTVSSAGCFPTTVFTTIVTVNPIPSAAPTNSGPICVGTVTLTATPSGGATIFSWTGPGGFTSAAQNPVVSPTITSTYSLTVSSGAASGCSPSTVYVTAVTVNTVSSASPSAQPICVGGTTSLLANPSGGTATIFTWSGPNLSSTTAQNPTATPTITSTYSLVVSAPGCAPSPVFSVLATVASQPAVTALSSSATNPFCVGGIMTLNATSSGGAGTATYSWSGPDITAATSATNVSPSFTTAGGATTGAYSVTLAYSGSGCVTTAPFASQVYTITAAPSITSLSSSASNPFCGGASMTLTAVATPGAGTALYTWSGPGIATTTGNSNVSPLLSTSIGAATGAYSVSVAYLTTGCNAVGPVASATYTLTGQPSLTGIVSSATNPMCVGGVMTLTATSGGGAGTPTYTWSGPDIITTTSSTNQSPSFTTAGGPTTGTYNVTYSTAGTGCNTTGPVSTAIYTITAVPLVTALTSSASNPFCVGATMTLTATSTGGAGSPTYAWSGPDITATTSATNVSPSFTTSGGATTGAYSVIATYPNTGCVSSAFASAVYTITAQPSITGLSLSASNPFCVGASITLTAATGGGAGTPTYTWSGPGIPTTPGSSAVSPSIPTFGAPTSGAYSVTLSYPGTGCNAAGPFTSAVYTLTAQPSLTGIVSSATNPMCVGGVMTLTATSGGGAGAATYTWSGPDITTTTSSSNPSPSFTTVGGSATGAYSVTFSTAGTGCNAAGPVATAIYTITAVPSVTALSSSASNPFCVGATMTLTATSSGGAGSPTYAWSGPDITAATSATNVSPSFTTSGGATTGAYSVIATYPSTGCISSSFASAVYTITAQPSIASLTTPNSNPFCEGTSLVLTANTVMGGAGASVYTWSGPGISVTTGSTNVSPTFTPTVGTGAYDVLLTFDGTGCNSVSQVTASVYTVAPTPAVTTTGGGGTFCGSTTINAGGGAGGIIYFQGTTSGGTSIAVPSASQVVTVTGTYYFRAQSTAGCWGPQGSVSVTINPVPSAAPTSNGPICVGGTVNLNAVPGANTSVFTWSGANLSATNIANPTATPTITGTYSLTVSDGSGNAGCAPATIYTVSVTVNATPTAGPTNNGYICNGGTVTLNANPGTATTFAWTGANITGSTSSSTTTAAPSTTSIYTLVVTDGTSQPGCSSTYTTNVTVNGAPSAAPSNNGYICNGGSVLLSANGSGTTSTYAWSGSNITGGITTNTTTATPTTTSVYSVIVTDGSTQPGCSLQFTTTVSVNAVPTAAPTNNGYICNGGTVTLNAGSGTATTFAWSGANITGSSSSSVTTATPTSTSVYTVFVTDGSSQSGCINLYTTTVSVNATPTAGPTNNGYICNGGTVTLNANPAGGASSFVWSGAGLVSTAGASTTANPTVTSVYTLTVSDGSAQPGCAPATQYLTTVSVNATPVAAPSNNGYICVGGTVQLFANESGSSTTFAWTGANITGSVSTNNTTAAPTALSVYTITVSDGSTQPGCVKQYNTTVSVNATPTAAPTNDGYICNGGVVNLTANGANGATTFAWTGANITGSATAANTTATPSVTGTYTLMVTDGSSQPGCSPSTQYTTTVSVNATPTASPTNDGYICNGGTVNLAANPAGGASVFVWSGPALSSTSGANTTATPVGISIYTLTVTDGSGRSGCSPATMYTTTVNVHAAPTASPTNDGPICVGGTVNLFANPSGGATSFTWSGAGLPVTSGATPVATPTLTSTYTLTVSDGSGKSGCAPATQYNTTVTVNGKPSLSSASNNSPVCETFTLNLTANDPVNVAGYSWSGPVAITNALTGNASVPNATTDASGVYTVAVNNGIGSGCFAVYFTTATVNALPKAFNVTGGGGYCASDSGVHIGLSNSESGVNYQLFNGATGLGTLPGTGASLDFGLQTVLGTYTVLATNAATFCTNAMNSSAIVSINPVPVNTYEIVSAGTHYCFGDTGIMVSLDGSDTGINYQLYLGSYAVGSPVAGPGGAFDFGLQTGAGDYMAIATNAHTGCRSLLTGFIAIVVDSLPRMYSVTGGGGYCAGGAGIDIGLSGSDTGITYNMYNSGASGSLASAGTGSPLDFGMQTAAGTVSVVATNNSTGCHTQMAGTPIISINPLPDVHNVTGGGTYCEGTGGVPVGLNTSDTGVVYSLYNGGSLVTSATGTGGSLSFGLQTAAGTYTVSAYRTFTGCTIGMADSAVIVEHLAPTIYTVTGGGPYCSSDPGVALGLGGSDTGVTYTLYNLAATVTTFAGSGASLAFGTYPAGSYSVSAANNITGCTSDMSGVRVITMNASPVVHNVTGGGGYCADGAGVHVFLNVSDTGVNYQLYRDGASIGTMAGTGLTLDFGLLTTPGTYTVSAVNAISGCGSDMADSAVVSIISLVTPSITVSTGSGDTTCLGSTLTFTATASNGGGTPAYSWDVNGTVVPAATSDTYSYVPANGDVVTATLVSSAACATPATVSVTDTITVLVPQAAGVTLTADPGTNVCSNTTVTYTAMPVYGGANPTYVWKKNGVTITGAGGPVYSYIPVDGDNISVHMTSDYPCLTADTASGNVAMHVGVEIAPVVEIIAMPGTTILAGALDTLIASVSSSGPVTYQWLINNSAISGATNAVFISSFNNNDSVTCEVTSSNGCALAGFNSVRITVLSVGINPVVIGETNLRLIPNPNKGEFSISGTLGTAIDEEITMEITDMLGQVIYKNKVIVPNGVMEEKIILGNTLANGMYIMNVNAGGGHKVFHFVVEQ